MSKDVKRLEQELDKAMVAKDKAQVKAVMKQLEEAEKAEAKVLKAEADAKWAEQSKAREELTAKVTEAINKAVSGFRAEIVKLVGEDESVLRYSIDYKAALTTCSIVRSKPRATGTGNGGKHGKIQELFDKYASDTEKQALADAIAKAREHDSTARVDGIEYKHRAAVEKRLIVAGTIQPR